MDNKEKSHQLRRDFSLCLYVYKPNSVSSSSLEKWSWTISIYLAPRLLSGSSGTSLDYSRDTALHQSKDFAVSLSCFHEITPLFYNSGVLWLSPKASLLAPLGLLPTGVTRYSCPDCSEPDVRTFLCIT